MAQILVLDDDEVSGRLVARMLRKSGHEVKTATTAEEAWQLMTESPVDLMILDTELAEEHGWDVLGRIRKDVIFRDLPVIIHSTNSRREVVERYIDLGVQGILLKPCRADRLSHDVEKIMQNPWTNKLFEPEEVVRNRTGLSSSGVRGLYRDALGQLNDAIEAIVSLKSDPENASSLARLAAIRSCAVNVGFDLMVRFVDAIKAALTDKDGDRVAALVDRLSVLTRLLEERIGDDEQETDDEGEAAGDEVADGEGENPGESDAAGEETSAEGEAAVAEESAAESAEPEETKDAPAVEAAAEAAEPEKSEAA